MELKNNKKKKNRYRKTELCCSFLILFTFLLKDKILQTWHANIRHVCKFFFSFLFVVFFWLLKGIANVTLNVVQTVQFYLLRRRGLFLYYQIFCVLLLLQLISSELDQSIQLLDVVTQREKSATITTTTTTTTTQIS